MKDRVIKAGPLKPSSAIIRARTQGDFVISAISIRDRLIKNCISSDIKTIIVLVPAEQKKPPCIEYANEKSSTVEYVDAASLVNVPDLQNALYIEDGFLLRTSLLDDFLAADSKVMKSPTSDRIIFSKGGFVPEAAPQYAPDEIFDYDPFYVLEIREDNCREARSRLFKWLSKDSDGFISKKLNRPVSSIFSKFFADYPLPPLYFSAATAFFALLMTYVLIGGGETGILWGCILFHVTSVVDGIDGEIARAKFQASEKGAKIDTTVDMITNVLFMGTMSYALWSTYGNSYLILGIYIVVLAMIGVSLMTLLVYFGPGGGDFDILAGIIKKRFEGKPRLLKIFNFSNYCLKRDFFAFLFAVLGLLGLGKYIPEFLIFGLIIWNIAIILNARAILTLKEVTTAE